MGRFVAMPRVVFPADARARLKIDLLPLVLADVSDEEIAGYAIERESPGISQSKRPDLIPERIRRRITVWQRAHVDAQHFSEELCEIGRRPQRVAGAAAVA